MKNSLWFGWILQHNPNFWEDNGYEKINSDDFHYYGCDIAKLNKHPVYRKSLYLCHDMEEESMVEVFSCELGSIQHSYIVAIHTWNNAGGYKFSLDLVTQVSTVDSFNNLIIENIGDNLENGSYILKQNNF